jgi:hypothetical protein
VTHLAREELERWWTEGRPADRDRIEGHLAACDACGALYGEVIDSLPLPAGLAAGSDQELAARGLHAFAGGQPRALRVPPRAALWAAAAALAAAALVPLLGRPGPEPPDGIRGASLQPLEPLGTVAPPVRFAWASPVRAAGYVVEVRDPQKGLVFSLSSAEPPLDVPPERLARLTPGWIYWWTVIARDASGEEIMRSPPRSFVVVSVPR